MPDISVKFLCLQSFLIKNLLHFWTEQEPLTNDYFDCYISWYNIVQKRELFILTIVIMKSS